MKSKIQLGVIGLGQRGKNILNMLLKMDDVDIIGICDTYSDRAENGRDAVVKARGGSPVCTRDYKELLSIPSIDAVFIATSWEHHIDIAVDAMNKGIYVGMEVGGAYTINSCWELVRTHEKTGTHCMMIENCCYGKYELMALNMARLGLFGEIVHCSGGYHHDLRDQISTGDELRHYRQRNYINRNCENYPTHELGPIAQLLNINRGNIMVSLSSFGSSAEGMKAYYKAKYPDKDIPCFKQSDIVTTVIKCAGGQTITLTLDTTLPRAYSRGYTVRGTKGGFFEDNLSVYLEDEHGEYHDGEKGWREQFGNAEGYYEKYKHPTWDAYEKEGVREGHGGMDWLAFRDFVDAVKKGEAPPIDVYDTAAWMCVTALSEKSITLGGLPVEMPDFTDGKWLIRASQ